MDFRDVAAPAVDVETKKDIEAGIVGRIADDVISPVLISFVWWVLASAVKNGHKKLYFLARDAYSMHRIAKRFCERFGLGMDCRYLHGSRLAWRSAAYSLVGDEKYDNIFSGGYLLTPRVILERAMADAEQRAAIYGDINKNNHSSRYALSNENYALSPAEMKAFAEKLKTSGVFGEYLDELSNRQFRGASMYLRQEGVFDGSDIAVVDSGWTGSIQRTLRQIAERSVRDPKITGYYFGLYAQSADTRDGAYETWYFGPKSRVSEMTNFNNNVFECMCACPSHMTSGYEFSGREGRYVPIFRDSGKNNFEMAELICDRIDKYSADFLSGSGMKFEDYSEKYLDMSKKILRRFMINPTKDEAEAFGRLTFCDDASDSYDGGLVCAVDKKYLKNYIAPRRFMQKISKRKIPKEAAPDLFWLHGSLAASGIKRQNRYRFNYKLWETLRLIAKKRK